MDAVKSSDLAGSPAQFFQVLDSDNHVLHIGALRVASGIQQTRPTEVFLLAKPQSLVAKEGIPAGKPGASKILWKRLAALVQQQEAHTHHYG